MRKLFALALIILGGCTTVGTGATSNRAADYVRLAASSDAYEIESSRLALQRSRDPWTRAHAALMIRDHGYTSAQLASAAAEQGIVVPAGMMPMQAAMMRTLEGSASFDATYRQQQIEAHRQALALHDRYARRGDRPALRGVAAVAVPIVRSHLDHLRP